MRRAFFVLGDVTDQFIGACRALDSWFIQKRLILTMGRPEYQLADVRFVWTVIIFPGSCGLAKRTGSEDKSRELFETKDS